MIESSQVSQHIAGIIPVAGEPLGFNMPWHDCLMPIHDDYHAIERAVNTAAVAGCNTIWIVLRRDSAPIIRKKIGEWIYDPSTTWIYPKPFWNKREIPIYYVSIRPRDRKKRDSTPWSTLYGAKMATWISRKISKWVVPKRFLVVSPYGVIDEKVIEQSRDALRGDKNILYTINDKTFLDNEHLPFTFNQKDYLTCARYFKEICTGQDLKLTFNQLFNPINIENYNKINAGWYHRIDNWDGYRKFLSSEQNSQCLRPKYMRIHKWHNFVDSI